MAKVHHTSTIKQSLASVNTFAPYDASLKWPSHPHGGFTIVMGPALAIMAKLLKGELAKELFDQSDAMERVRIPCFGGPNDDPAITSVKTIVEGFRSFYIQMSTSMPYQDSIGQTIPAVPPPKICLSDLYGSEILRVIREINDVPCLAIHFGSAAILIRRSCPAKYSGLGDTIENVEKLAIKTGKSADEILFKAYYRDEKEIIHIPGLPPMFDYEFTPGTSPFLNSILLMLRRYHATFKTCDGLILTSNRVYEREPINFLKTFMEETNRSCYVLGLAGSISLEQAAREQRSPASTAVVEILDKTLKRYGQRSLIYVSFGSVFWPTNVEASWKILEIIVEQNIPMIISYNEKRVPMPGRLSHLLESSDNVVVTSWSPQKMILNHKSTGWFISHCGLNSVIESLSHGIPMIAWPIDSDQPMNAAHVSLNLEVAYELLEVRTDRGLKPLYRGAQPIGTMESIEKEFRTVLANAFGEDGKVKRRNAEFLKEKLNELWDDGGESTSELGRFILDYSLS